MSFKNLSVDKVKQLLKFDSEVMLFESLESTNLFAKELAAGSKANEGDLVIALSQTAGKGRMGRSFYSPKGNGVYFSIVLRPEIKAEDISLITPTAAVAVAKAIEDISKKSPKIKWVNDIFLNGKKVCGILSEAAFNSDGSAQYVILGIGINLKEPEGGFPDEIKNIAGSLFSENEDFNPNEILAAVVNNFFELYKDLKSKTIPEEYRKRMMLVGENIIYTVNTALKSGRVVDVDNSFRLIIETESGDMEALQSGEVTIGSKNI